MELGWPSDERHRDLAKTHLGHILTTVEVNRY
jgi:hypothetical protein